MELTERLNIAKKLVIEAGHAILEIYNTDFDVDTKGDSSPVTAADLAADKIITEGLIKAFPEDGILTEEQKDDGTRLEKELVWIVDPLDGTKEFISRNGEFTVNMGLVYKGTPVLGVIYVPALDELYYGTNSTSAYLEAQGKKSELSVSSRSSISEMILVKSRSHATEKLAQLIDRYHFADTRASGSSVKGCRVASGDADVYYRFGNTHEWDVCAMHAIVEAAGGMMTDLKGHTITYNNENTLLNGFIVSNGNIHKQLVEMSRDG